MNRDSWLQKHPHFLELSYQVVQRLFRFLKPLLSRLGFGRADRLMRPVEELSKRVIFDCRMCGQCVLHSTGMTCPMTCPKQLRNGPCGGVCMDGSCEVIPENDCVWAKAVERSAKTPWDHELSRLNPPVDWRLENLASWVTFATGRDQTTVGGREGAVHTEDARQ